MKKLLFLIVFVSSLGHSQQLYRQIFSAGVATSQYGISMPGEAFNSVYITPDLIVGESILYLISQQNPLSTKEVVLDSEITLYPNPVSDKLYIKGLENSKAEVVLYDYLGKQIMCKPLLNNYLDVSNLSPGMYILILSNERSFIKQKIIKQ